MALIDLETNDLWQEAARIFSGVHPKQKIEMSAVLQAGEETIEVESVVGFREEADYVDHHAALLFLQVTIKGGDYLNRLLPNKENTTIDLTITVNGIPKTLQQYRVGVYDNSDAKGTVGDGGLENTQELNTHHLLDIDLHIANPLYEQIRQQTITNIPINMTLENAIRLYLAPTRWAQWDTPPSHALPTRDQILAKEYEGEVGVDVVPIPNDDVKEAIIIPRPTKLTALVPYLQKEYGLYGEGAGRFHDKGFWYVYPLYNLSRYLDERRTLTIFNLPEGKLPYVERGHRVEDGKVYILSNEKTEAVNDRWLTALQQGDSTRYLNAAKVMDDFAVKRNNKVSFNHKENLIGLSVKKREDDLNEVREEVGDVSCNHLARVSALAPLRGEFITFIWRNSNPDLLYPGMPVGYFFAEDRQYKRYTGTLLQQTTLYRKENPSDVRDKYFVRDTVLTIFVGEIE